MASKTVLPVDLMDGITLDNLERVSEWLDELLTGLSWLRGELETLVDAKAADDA